MNVCQWEISLQTATENVVFANQFLATDRYHLIIVVAYKKFMSLNSKTIDFKALKKKKKVILLQN